MIYPNDNYFKEFNIEEIRLDMAHRDVSADDKYIAIGEQESCHLILDAETYNVIEEIDAKSEYASYGMFDAQSRNIMFNSCHFYNGITTGFNLLDIGKEDFQEEDIIIDDDLRIYAGVSKNDEYIIGDADGCITSYKVD